jgi:hypothetical protein
MRLRFVLPLVNVLMTRNSKEINVFENGLALKADGINKRLI